MIRRRGRRAEVGGAERAAAEGGREGGAPAEGRELPLSGVRPDQRAWRRSREPAA